LVHQEAAAWLEATQPGQTSGEWEAEEAICQGAAALREAARQNETGQPASTNEEGELMMDNNEGNIH
jgi:hypothetical protein